MIFKRRAEAELHTTCDTKQETSYVGKKIENVEKTRSMKKNKASLKKNAKTIESKINFEKNYQEVKKPKSP